jgi:hypothetical protein
VGKGRRNQRNPDYYKVQGGAIESRDVGRKSKQALGRDEARRRSTPRRKKTTQPRAAQPRKKASPAPPPSSEGRAPPLAPGAALSRVGITHRVMRAAGTAWGVLRWAGHMVNVMRGKTDERHE